MQQKDVETEVFVELIREVAWNNIWQNKKKVGTIIPSKLENWWVEKTSREIWQYNRIKENRASSNNFIHQLKYE